MAKLSSKDIVTKVREKAGVDRKTFSFRLPKSLMARLKKSCEERGIRVSLTLEVLIEEFLGK